MMNDETGSNNMRDKTNGILSLCFMVLIIILFPLLVYDYEVTDTIQPEKVVISGRVTVSSAAGIVPLPGVKLVFSSLAGERITETTDIDGRYSHEVDAGWTGTVTPAKIAFIFAPMSQAYENVVTDLTDQDYTATQIGEILSISGRVTTAEGPGVPGVLLEFSHDQGVTTSSVTVSDGEGNYDLPVEPGWTGMVTPSKDGFKFEPAAVNYENISTDLSGQDYTASPVPLVISGRVAAKDGTGISGVILTFSGSAAFTTGTDLNGNFRQGVPQGWTGTITPAKSGYEFAPPVRTVENVNFHRPFLDYTAEAVTPVISGIITTMEGVGIPGVTLGFSNNGGTAVTDGDGRYNHAVESRWSGTVSLSKTGYTFSPGGAPYNRVRSDIPGQDYTGATGYPVISGRAVTQQGTGVPGVKVDFPGSGEIGFTYTDARGNYFHAVPPGWSGSAAASNPRYGFSPSSLSYENVTAHLANRDYIASPVLPFISGRIAAAPGRGIGDVFLVFSNNGGSAATNAHGIYIHTIPRGWWGTVTPAKTSYTFSPGLLEYADVTGSRSQQDFLALEHFPRISGKVTKFTTAGSRGLPGVTLIFSDAEGGGINTAETDAGGFYQHDVSIGWSGTLALEKPGCVFLPSSQTYLNVMMNLPGQNFYALPGSVELNFQASRKIAGGLVIKRQYGEIHLTPEITGNIPIAIYIISRKEHDGTNGTGSYRDIKIIKSANLQSGDTDICRDMDIQAGITYTYKVRAEHKSGITIKESGEVEI
jgi:hypothetical protein